MNSFRKRINIYKFSLILSYSESVLLYINILSFLEELKKMVSEIVLHVLSDNSGKITAATPSDEAPQKGTKSTPKTAKPQKRKSGGKGKAAEQPLVCPVCRTGQVIQGKTAYGCSRWKEGCTFRLPFGENGQPFDNDTLRKIIQEYNPNTNSNHE